MDDIEPTPQQLLAALDASELAESVRALTDGQCTDLIERVALLVGANRSLSVDEFRGELTDILDSGPTFHAVLHGGQFDGQVMELDPEDYDADVICAAVEEEAPHPLHSLYRLSEGEPGPGATVHYRFGGLVAVDVTESGNR
ncbi:hypothetical protein [Humibacter albus]|uniref:hypothetical protein n=1 Tax=Humibacter albus TaxID=427754 RepID=UPI0003B7010C|nr:hypothetical protein [Humibacter albus]